TRGRKKKSTHDTKNTDKSLNTIDIFSNTRIFFIPNNIDKVRLRLLKEKVIERGGQVVEAGFNASVTHVITALESQKALEILGIRYDNIPKSAVMVDPNWISECLMSGKLVDVKPYIAQTSDVTNNQSLKQVDKRIHDDLTDEDSENERNNQPKKKKGQESLPPTMRYPYPSSGSSSDTIIENDPLLEMIAESKSLAEAIAEIINTGNLKRLQHLSEEQEVIKKFGDIFGVGSSTAMKWYAKGYRTFDDILQNVELTHAQRIGIEYFDELNEKIPRDEVTEISKRVEEAAHQADPNLLCITVGSYIRGQPICGDIDILVTKKGSDEKKDMGAFSKLLNILRTQGLLTHDLSQRHGKKKTPSKYYAICRLPGGKHHQIDFFVVSYNELGAALIAYTGNEVFNRSLRLLAKKQKMNLNHHGLYKNVSRDGITKLNKGVLVAQRTEKEIFDALGVSWR
ncbi:6496_t:CDS:10, partial [Scutellospora calospora]